jgi:hypothetical protein
MTNDEHKAQLAFTAACVEQEKIEAARDQPSRFAVWRLIVSPSAGKHAPRCVGDCALDGICRLIEGNKEDKDCLSPDLKRFQKCSSTATAQVAIGGNSWTYECTIKFFDADGNLIFTACGRGTGTRFQLSAAKEILTRERRHNPAVPWVAKRGIKEGQNRKGI